MAVQPRRREFRVHREPTQTGYRVNPTLRRGERISPVACPDLEISVDDILG